VEMLSDEKLLSMRLLIYLCSFRRKTSLSNPSSSPRSPRLV
jgi:hypothetical protein